MSALDKTGLEPCPFCGGKDLVSEGDDKIVGYRCRTCEATGPNHYNSRFDWNRRASITSAGVTEEQTPAAKWRQEGKEDPHGNWYDCERAKLAMGHLTDDELANAVFMADRSSLDLIAYQTAAKDRIRWLSRALEASRVAPVSQKEAAPVAWRWQSPMTGWVFREEKPADWPSEPLYASPAPAVEPVGIKALEWSTEFSGTPRADDTFGRHYLVYQEFNSGWVLCIDGIRIKDQIPSSAEAKAAAQADYEACIRSALHPTPTPPVAVCSVMTMEHSAGSPDYYVSIERNGRQITPHKYGIRGRAEYDVAEWNWLLNGGDKPDILAFDTDTTPTPVSAPVGVVTGYRLEFQSRADETGYRMKGRQGFATFERAVEFMRKGLAVGQLFTRLTREERFDMSEDALAALRSPAVEGK